MEKLDYWIVTKKVCDEYYKWGSHLILRKRSRSRQGRWKLNIERDRKNREEIFWGQEELQGG